MSLVDLLNRAVQRSQIGDRDGAVADLRELATRLDAAADQLEASGELPRDTGGTSDRVRAQVYGPDGKLKQSIDTGA